MIRKMYALFSECRLRLHSFFQLWKVTQHGRNNVFGRISIIQPEHLTIGSNCSFNHEVYINASNMVILGNDVIVSAGAKILSTGIDYVSWGKGKKQHTKGHGVVIGDHVWIGAGAQILQGVTVSGKYVVIAAGAVVTEDITEDYVIFGGVPAKKVKNYANMLQ